MNLLRKNKNYKYLKKKSFEKRLEIFIKFYKLSEGHPGYVFSIIDILTVLYFNGYVRVVKKGKTKTVKDDIIMSKGHATVGQYPFLKDLNIISKSDWKNWGEKNLKSRLRMFGNTKIPGIKTSTGSLGHGIGLATGISYAAMKNKSNKRVYVIISEGELYEGSTWESLLLLSHLKLREVYIILDVNNNIILGKTSKCLDLGNIKKKLESFNIKTYECNGHNFKEVDLNFKKMIATKGPTCLIAKTIKGYGLKLMENKAKWHYWNPISMDDYSKCIDEIKKNI